MENDLISRQAAIEALGEPFVMSQCMTMEECDHMNFARALCIARIESIEAAQQWVPVTERLPEEKKAVLVWQPRYLNSYTAILADGEWFVFGGYGTKVFEVTHWMPLPEPPKEEP